jgi:hypothetical protein
MREKEVQDALVNVKELKRRKQKGGTTSERPHETDSRGLTNL